MDDTKSTFSRLERRARRVRAILWGALFGWATAAAVLVSIGIHAVLSRTIPYDVQIAVCAPLTLAALGYVIGSVRSIDVARVLLRADVTLDLDARLTTLHEIGWQPSMEPIARRVAAGLPPDSINVRQALPFRLRELMVIVTAAVFTVAAIAVAAIPPRVDPAGPPLAEEGVAIVEGAVDESPDPSETIVDDSEPMSPEVAETHEDEDTAEPYAFNDILAEIRPDDAADTSLIDDTSAESLTTRAKADTSLEDVLRQIEGRLAGEDDLLSAAEIAALEAFRDAGTGPLAETLDSLLQTATREDALRRISDILTDRSLQEERQGLRLDFDEMTGEPAGENETGATLETASGTSDGGDETPGEPGNQGTAFPMFDSTTQAGGELVLVGAALPSVVGEEGEFKYYLTKGVPIEPPMTSNEVPEDGWSLSYEQAESILSTRTLPDDVLDAVRAYFVRITEGGS